MYLRQLSCDGSRFVHGAVHARLAFPGPISAWFDAWLLRVEELVASNGITLSKRVVLTPEDGLDVLLQAVAPVHLAQRLREILASIPPPGKARSALRLPADDAELQRLLDDAPVMRTLLVLPRYVAADLWFACPFRAADAWSRVAGRASAAVGYQVNLYPYTCPAALMRAMALNLNRLLSHTAVSAPMRWLQGQLAERARRARWLQEDILLASAAADGALWMRQVEATFGSLHAEFSAPTDLTFAAGALQDTLELACAFDEALTYDPSYTASQVQDLAGARIQLGLAEDFDAVATGIARRPSVSQGAQRPNNDGAFAPVQLPGYADTAAGAPSEPYVFLSYARADEDDMRRVRDRLRAADVDVWVDERIEAGQEWDVVLEARLRGCGMVVALISPEAVASRWVRRELKFADSLGKPLACLRLREATLTDGLGMLLLTLQWIDMSRGDAEERLLSAVRLGLQEAG